MFKCLLCGAVFHNPIAISGNTINSFGYCVNESFRGCPSCHDVELEEAEKCDLCGEYVAKSQMHIVEHMEGIRFPTTVISSLCTSCYIEEEGKIYLQDLKDLDELDDSSCLGDSGCLDDLDNYDDYRDHPDDCVCVECCLLEQYDFM